MTLSIVVEAIKTTAHTGKLATVKFCLRHYKHASAPVSATQTPCRGRRKYELPSNKLIAGTFIALYLSFFNGSSAEAEGLTETQYILNTFSFLIHGFLVMFMAAGFAMLESGLVRSKNTVTICLKNIALTLAGLMFYLIGYNLMYLNVDGGYFGDFVVQCWTVEI